MTLVGMDVHAQTIAGDLSDATRELLGAAHLELHELGLATAIAVTPVGSAPQDKHPGLMKRSWKNHPSSIKGAIDALQPTSILNEASHGLVIDRGRRRSENAHARKSGSGTELVPSKRRREDGSVVMVRRRKSTTIKAGRMLGSEQAPLGVKGQVLRKLKAEERAIFERAAAAAEQKVKR